jgi:hypothetical protein
MGDYDMMQDQAWGSAAESVGGRVHDVDDLKPEHAALIDRITSMRSGTLPTRRDMLALLGEAAELLDVCPRMGCATCSFMSKHETAAR